MKLNSSQLPFKEKIKFEIENIKGRNEEKQISTSNLAPEFTTAVLVK